MKPCEDFYDRFPIGDTKDDEAWHRLHGLRVVYQTGDREGRSAELTGPAEESEAPHLLSLSLAGDAHVDEWVVENQAEGLRFLAEVVLPLLR